MDFLVQLGQAITNLTSVRAAFASFKNSRKVPSETFRTQIDVRADRRGKCRMFSQVVLDHVPVRTGEFIDGLAGKLLR